jgi:hypothetical protein
MGDLDSDRRCEVVLIMTRTEGQRLVKHKLDFLRCCPKRCVVPEARKGSTLTDF